MIKIKNNKIQITKQKTLSKKQILKIKQLSLKEQQEYCKTVLGLSKNRIHGINSELKSRGTDRLSEKSPSEVLNLFKRLLRNSSETLHVPNVRNSTTQWIGVEIECLVEGEGSSDSNHCEYCEDGTVSCSNCEGDETIELEDSNGNTYSVRCKQCSGEGYETCPECDGNSSNCEGECGVFDDIRRALSKNNVTRCSVKSDGSLSSDDGLIGVEVTVLFDASKGFEPLRKACKVLNDFGATVNGTCGLHVHIDQYGKNLEQVQSVGQKFDKYLPILSKLVPKSRRDNRYCKLGVSTLDGCRYYAVNLTSFKKHKTIEIRLHSGTTDSKKIEHWINLLNRIATSVANVGYVDTFQALIDSLKLPDSIVEFYDKRFQKFNDSNRDDNEHSGLEQSQTETVEVA